MTDRNDERASELTKRFGSRRESDSVICGGIRYSPDSNRPIGGEFTQPMSLGSEPLHNGMAACVAYVHSVLEDGEPLLLYIHGYRNTFEDAIRRAIGMAQDLKFPGVVLVWSWPADGHTAAYSWDEESSEWTKPHLSDFITALTKLSDVNRIDFIAHSLGGRILLSVLVKMAETGTVSKTNAVVFAAPDVAQDNFVQDISRAKRAAGPHGPAKSITLYASWHDRALYVSESRHESFQPGSGRRAGSGGPEKILVTEGVDSIDASGLASGLWGHGYVFEHPKAISDVAKIIIEGLRASQRGLEEKPKGNGRYWLLKE